MGKKNRILTAAIVLGALLSTGYIASNAKAADNDAATTAAVPTTSSWGSVVAPGQDSQSSAASSSSSASQETAATPTDNSSSTSTNQQVTVTPTDTSSSTAADQSSSSDTSDTPANNPNNATAADPTLNRNYASDSDGTTKAANDMRLNSQLQQQVVSDAIKNKTVTDNGNEGQQDTVDTANFDVSDLGVDGTSSKPDGLDDADNVVKTTKDLGAGKTLTQYFNKTTKQVTVSLPGTSGDKYLTLNDNGYSVVTGNNGTQYKIFNPGTGDVLLQNNDFATKKAIASVNEQEAENAIRANLEAKGILAADGATQAVSNVAGGVVDGVGTGINSVVYGLGSVLNATWIGALVGIPLQIGVAISYGVQSLLRLVLGGLDTGRRVALYVGSLVPTAANTLNTDDNYANAKAVADNSKLKDDPSQPASAATAEKNALTKDAIDLGTQGVALGVDTAVDAVGLPVYALVQGGATLATYAAGIITGALAAVPIVGTVAQIIGGPVTIGGLIGSSAIYDGAHLLDDIRRAGNKGAIFIEMTASGLKRVQETTDSVIAAYNAGGNNGATVYKLM